MAAPLLEDLKTRKCSPEELQAALVQLIEIVNNNARNCARKCESNCVTSQGIPKVEEPVTWQSNLWDRDVRGMKIEIQEDSP